MSVESQLHRVPGLASKFIEINDDFLFGAPVWPHDFWTLENDCQPNYVYYCVRTGKYSFPKANWKTLGPYFGSFGNVLAVFNKLLKGRSKSGPPIPFHLPQMMDREVMEEMVSVPEIAKAIDNIAKQRFRSNTEAFNTQYAYTTYLQEWPRNISVEANHPALDDRSQFKYRTTIQNQLPVAVYWSVGYQGVNAQLKEMRRHWKRGTKFWALNDVRHANKSVTGDELLRLDRAILEFFDEKLPAAPWELDNHLYIPGGDTTSEQQ